MNQDQITKAVNVLKDGGVIMFPTDTIWGIGASVESKEGIAKLYKLKKRPTTKPTAILVANRQQADRYGIFSDKLDQLANQYWPGALTIITESTSAVPSSITGNTSTVGIRVPAHLLVQGICKKLNASIVTASANLAHKPAPTSRREIDPQLINQVDFVIGKDSTVSVNQASTIATAVDDKIQVLRQGSVKV